jgi:hypothetical protein
MAKGSARMLGLQRAPGLHRLLWRGGMSVASTTPAAVPTVCAGSGLTVTGPLTRSDRVATLEEAKAQFQKSWDAWKAWAKLEEVPGES